MPLALLAIVYVPLRQALDEVAWQVRVRAAVHDSLTRIEHEVVQSRVRVERREIDVLVVLLGKTSDADASRARLQTEIRAASDVLPRTECSRSLTLEHSQVSSRACARRRIHCPCCRRLRFSLPPSSSKARVR
jgi:hypothetical protein